VDEFPEFEIGKDILHETPDWTRLELELAVPLPASIRLDRMLASELPISRSRLQSLYGGTLRINPDRADILRRRVRTGTLVTIDLATEAKREKVWRPLATGHPL
jgi:hypothetical protein